MIRQLVIQHFKLGYTRLLLVIDLGVLLLIVFDIISFMGKGYSLGAAATHLTSTGAEIREVLIFELMLLVVLPIIIASCRIIGLSWWEFRIYPNESPMLVAVAHAVMTAAFVAFFPLSSHMQRLSGLAQLDGQMVYLFPSHFSSVIRSSWFYTILASLGSLFTLAMSTILAYILIGKEPPRAFTQFALRAELSDLPSELRPVMPGNLLLSQSSDHPPIEYVSRKASEVMKAYMKKAPGSKTSIAFLDGIHGATHDAIRKHVIESPSDEYEMSLYTGTHRALEAALAGATRPDVVVLSPFVSPNVAKTVRGLAPLAGYSVERLRLDPQQTNLSWGELQASLSQQLLAARIQGKSVVLLLSEVFYASGLRIPLDAHIQSLKDAVAGTNRVVTIIDGTNAVGNRQLLRLLPAMDYYVFAPYRWLLASERSGVLVSRKSAPKGDIGLWIEGERKTIAQAAGLAGLRGAVDLLEQRGYRYFADRCEKLRRELILNLPKSIGVIGATSGVQGSFVVACAPVGDARWKLGPEELEREVSRRCSCASVVDFGPNAVWVRVAIPYFADVRDLNLLAELLNSASS